MTKPRCVLIGLSSLVLAFLGPNCASRLKSSEDDGPPQGIYISADGQSKPLEGTLTFDSNLKATFVPAGPNSTFTPTSPETQLADTLATATMVNSSCAVISLRGRLIRFHVFDPSLIRMASDLQGQLVRVSWIDGQDSVLGPIHRVTAIDVPVRPPSPATK